MVGEELASPAYATLADRIRLLAIDGRLVPDQRLPSERGSPFGSQ